MFVVCFVSVQYIGLLGAVNVDMCRARAEFDPDAKLTQSQVDGDDL